MYAIGPDKTPHKRTLQFGEPDSRYQTVQLQLYYVGRTKMTRTGFLNSKQVAQKMIIPEAYLIAFLGYRLRTKVFEKEGKEWLSGRYEPKIISRLVVDFIKMMILCDRCTKPELDILIRKGKTGYRCRACGHCTKKTYQPEKFQKYILVHSHLLPSPKGRKRGKPLTEKREPKQEESFSVDNSDSAVDARRKAANLPSIFQSPVSEEDSEEMDMEELLDAL